MKRACSVFPIESSKTSSSSSSSSSAAEPGCSFSAVVCEWFTLRAEWNKQGAMLATPGLALVPPHDTNQVHLLRLGT